MDKKSYLQDLYDKILTQNIDVGLLRAISVSGQRNEGRLLENLVFVELLRRKKRIVYYSDPQRRYEVDFVCRNGAEEELLQVCLDPTVAEVRERELRGLHSALKAFKRVRSGGLTVVTMDHRGTERLAGRTVEYTPAWEWLLARWQGKPRDQTLVVGQRS